MNRKDCMMFAVLLLVVGMLPVPAVLAAPAPDFSALAAYFPAETPFYMALGTAEADFLPLDALLATVLNAVPGTEGVNLRVTDLLDLALQVTRHCAGPLAGVTVDLVAGSDVRITTKKSGPRSASPTAVPTTSGIH